MSSRVLAATLLIAMVFGSPNRAFAAGEGAQSFTLNGNLYSDPAQTTLLLDSAVAIRVQILDSTQACILYEEVQTVNTTSSSGQFEVQVGSAVGAAKRGANDSAHTMQTVYSNTVTSLSGKALADGSACTYSPIMGDVRYLRLQVTPSSDNVTRTLTPNMTLDSVASALVAERAESLQGLAPSAFLQVGTGDLSQTNLQSVFASGNASKLVQLLSVPIADYVTLSQTNGTISVPTVASPSAPVAGQMWYSGGSIKYYDGTTTQTLTSSGGGAISSLIISTGLTPQGTITSGGSTIAVDVGTTVGKIVQVQTGGKLPALDGSLLTNLNGSAIQSGTIGGTTAVSTTGNLQTSGSVTGKHVYLQDNGTNFVGLNAPTAVTQTYSLTFPAAQGGSNTVLVNDGSGNLSWASQISGAVTSVTGSSPISVTGTATAPVVGLASQSANTVLAGPTSGASATPTFRGLTSADLPTTGTSGVYINGGNSFGSAATIGTNDSNSLSFKTGGTARAIFDTSGNFGIGTTAPGAKLDVKGAMRLEGSTSGYAGVQAAAGTTSYTLTLPAALPGSSGQVLTSDTSGNLSWSSASAGSVTSVGLTMPSIFSVTNSPVTSTGTLTVALATQTANTFWGGPTSGAAAAPTFRALAASDLPAGTATQWTTTGTNIYYNSGNVGIGVTAPAAPIDVKGVIRHEGATAGYLAEQAAANTTSYTITWPAAVASQNGYVLSSDTSGNLSWTSPSSGSVTSVGLAMPSIFTVTNSPVTSAGTLTAALANQSANFVFAGPTSGAATAPGFRALTVADLPTSGATGIYVNGGNAFGTAATIGTTDSNPFSVLTNNVTRATFDTSGNLGLGTTAPSFRLELSGTASPSNEKIGINGTQVLYQPTLATYAGTIFLGDGGSTLSAGASNDTGVGIGSLSALSSGASNTAVGYQSLNANTSGATNTAVGATALKANTTGASNAGFGSGVLLANTTGGSNTAVGASALAANTTNSYNVAVGASAAASNTAASNTAVGYQALNSNTTGTGLVAVGAQALQTSTGNNNTGVGQYALKGNTTGATNTALGHNALFSNAGANNNVAVGDSSLYNNTGSNNTALGTSTLNANTTGTASTAVGYNALTLSTGSQNIALGYNAGSAITTGANNVVIGSNTGSSIATSSNVILLSDGAANERARFDSSGNLGLGVTAPGAKLDVNGGLRLEGSTTGYVGVQASASTTSYNLILPAALPGSSGLVLTSDTSGNLSWSNPSSGSVTSVATGTGLTGGPITSTGTISLAAIGSYTFLANNTAASAAPTATTLTSFMDNSFSSTQGAVLYRGASGWAALTPGSSGQLFQSGGASANPSWVNPTGGTVTSVGLTMPSIFTVTNSPVTSAGTLTASLASQSANFFFAGPTSGAAATPTFRALASTDLPAFTGDTTTTAGSSVTTTSKVNGVAYPASPSTNTVPVVTASNTITYETVPVLAGGTGTATGSITGTGALTFTAGANSNVNLYPNNNTGSGTGAVKAYGQIYSTESVVSSGTTADFSKGNVNTFTTASMSSPITLSNMQSGGAYTVIIATDTTSRTYTFSGCTTSKFVPANGPTSGSTVYTILYSNSGTCYITWITGF